MQFTVVLLLSVLSVCTGTSANSTTTPTYTCSSPEERNRTKMYCLTEKYNYPFVTASCNETAGWYNKAKSCFDSYGQQCTDYYIKLCPLLINHKGKNNNKDPFWFPTQGTQGFDQCYEKRASLCPGGTTPPTTTAPTASAAFRSHYVESSLLIFVVISLL
mmetsp:Transcript_12928/g.27696  ORF Transcript_12928/g.27696 Transcript_12928/m.27696 type:complete len:160 (-) Transcript_12928:3-482(-)